MNGERVFERSGVEEGQVVLPFYLLCDVSSSMQGVIAELNASIAKLRRAIIENPVLDDVTQMCIITFSDHAKVLLPMAQMSESALPQLVAEGGTHYGSAFILLARSITEDVAKLKGQGYRVYRPCAFFLTDGEPSDHDWHEIFRGTLTYDAQTGHGLKAHPVFVPFGFRDAHESMLRRLAYPRDRGRWYLAKDAPVESALSGMFQIISRTMITAGHTVASDRPQVILQLPTPDSGITQGDADEEWI